MREWLHHNLRRTFPYEWGRLRGPQIYLARGVHHCGTVSATRCWVGYAFRLLSSPVVFKVPDFQQWQRFWYQWFQCVEGGAEAVRRDPVGFARIQWETWSPPGWFDEAEFAATTQSFANPDWVAIRLNAYRALAWRGGRCAM
jgi:hypothetical protein